MKRIPFPAMLVCLISSITLLCLSCAALKNEFGINPGPGNMTTNGVGQVNVQPPISAQLNQAAPVVQATVPEPYGTLIAALLNLAATGAAAFATFHARSAAASAQTASASSAASSASAAASKGS